MKSEKDGENKYKRKPTIELWRCLGLSDTRTELLIQRLKWWQSVAKDPGHHCLYLAAMCGHLFCHGNRKAIPPSHPWIKQFMNDIREMAAIEGVDDIVEQILTKPTELFTNSELAQRFCNGDISYMRAAFISRHIPYARSQQHDIQSELNSAGIDGCWYALL